MMLILELSTYKLMRFHYGYNCRSLNSSTNYMDKNFLTGANFAVEYLEIDSFPPSLQF